MLDPYLRPVDLIFNITGKESLGALTQELITAQDGLERTRFLVERGAEPRAHLTEAQTELDRAENARDAELTARTSRKHDLGVQLRDARLAVRRAEVEGEQTLEQQWVRAPVADVRLVEVSTKGVSLEVVLLEHTDTKTAEVNE